MVAVKKENRDGALFVELKGAVDENTDFSKSIGAPESELILNCKGITRINSAGIREWVRYFGELRSNGLKIRFVECSHPLVQQSGFIKNMLPVSEVVSICVPFVCESCDQLSFPVTAVKDLDQLMNAPAPLCPKCAKPTVLDEDPNSYARNLRERR